MAAASAAMSIRNVSRVYIILFWMCLGILTDQHTVQGFSTTPPLLFLPHHASPSRRSVTRWSSTPLQGKSSNFKRKTRFHYNRQTPSQQKQKSLARGHLPLVSLNLNLDSLAKRGAAPRAQELLQRIEALHEEGYYAVAPDVVSFNCVLNAWARSTDDDSAGKAIEWLRYMTKDDITPTLVTYNTLILAFAKRGQAKKAISVLRWMQQESSFKPDTITFNSVLYAWATSLGSNGKKAESLLKEMMLLASAGNSEVKPDTISFNSVIHAYRYNPRRAHALLNHMETLYQAGNEDVEPDVYSFTSVIQAYAFSHDKEASVQVKGLLETMETLSKTRPHVAPNSVSYSCAMTAISKSKQGGAAHEVQALLDRMKQLYQQHGDIRVKPDIVAYTTTISAWAQDKNSPQAAQRALGLLEEMKSLQDHDVQPNAFTYTSVFTALANSRQGDAAEMAEALLLEEMTIPPSTIHFNAVINVHAKSPNLDKAERAMSLLYVMKANNVTTDIITYNSVLASCANSFGSKESKARALEIALEVYREAVHGATPVTYFLLFKTFRKLVPEGEARWHMIRQAFDKCCEAGLVSDRVVGQLQAICTAEQFRMLLSDTPEANGVKSVFPSDLPTDWTRHASKTR